MINSKLCHSPVLLYEAIDFLNLKKGGIVLDATLGGGGHALEILKRIIPGGKLIAIDKDQEAIERAQACLKEFGDKVVYVKGDFRDVNAILGREGIDVLDGAIFDLGISSFQIDEEGRGFSFLKNGPLDMRFDKEQKLVAGDVVNKFGKEELSRILREYGEERYALRIAGAIISGRKKKKIERTLELADIICKAAGWKYRNQRLHPATRSFQALRIYVNKELEALSVALEKTISFLRPKARICVISFHSLEDRIVKNVFCGKARQGELKLITKKPVSPGEKELASNSRARSAKLRTAEKI